MRLGSRITAAATTGPASGPRPASSTPATGKTPRFIAARSPLFADIPTLSELGYGLNPTRIYFGIVAPAGTPAQIVHKLRDEIAAIGNDPDFRRRRLIEMGLDPVLNTPEEFAAYLKQDRANAERVVRESGLQTQ